jgi:hypothetical protein
VQILGIEEEQEHKLQTCLSRQGFPQVGTSKGWLILRADPDMEAKRGIRKEETPLMLLDKCNCQLLLLTRILEFLQHYSSPISKPLRVKSWQPRSMEAMITCSAISFQTERNPAPKAKKLAKRDLSPIKV